MLKLPGATFLPSSVLLWHVTWWVKVEMDHCAFNWRIWEKSPNKAANDRLPKKIAKILDISQQQGGEGWTGGGPGWDKIPLLTVAGSPGLAPNKGTKALLWYWFAWLDSSCQKFFNCWGPLNFSKAYICQIKKIEAGKRPLEFWLRKLAQWAHKATNSLIWK